MPSTQTMQPLASRLGSASPVSLIVLGMAVALLGVLLVPASSLLGLVVAVVGGVVAHVGIIAKGVEIGMRAARDR